MNDLLDSAMMRDLFLCDTFDGSCPVKSTRACMALNILDGMYAPIGDGERYYDPEAKVDITAYAGIAPPFHPYAIRLPDWNQKPKHVHRYVCECGDHSVLASYDEARLARLARLGAVELQTIRDIACRQILCNGLTRLPSTPTVPCLHLSCPASKCVR